MKRISFFLILFGSIFLLISCNKENDTIDGDLEDHIVGTWLSIEVSYDGIICEDCDSLFTWIFESNGKMMQKNNDYGDHEIQDGSWEIDANNKNILFSYKEYAYGGTYEDYDIVTDTIVITRLSKDNLWIIEMIGYPPTTKMNIKFNKIE